MGLQVGRREVGRGPLFFSRVHQSTRDSIWAVRTMGWVSVVVEEREKPLTSSRSFKPHSYIDRALIARDGSFTERLKCAGPGCGEIAVLSSCVELTQFLACRDRVGTIHLTSSGAPDGFRADDYRMHPHLYDSGCCIETTRWMCVRTNAEFTLA